MFGELYLGLCCSYQCSSGLCSLDWMLSSHLNLSFFTPLSVHIHPRHMVHDAACFTHITLNTFLYLAEVTIHHSNCNNCLSLSVK